MAILDKQEGLVLESTEDLLKSAFEIKKRILTDGVSIVKATNYTDNIYSNNYKDDLSTIEMILRAQVIFSTNLNKIQNWLAEQNSVLGTNKTFTYLGMEQVLKDYFARFRVLSRALNPEISWLAGGEILVIADRELNDVVDPTTGLIEIEEFAKDLSSQISYEITNPLNAPLDYTPDLSVRYVLYNNQEKFFFYKKGINKEFWVKINYKKLKENFFPADIVSVLKGALLLEWSNVMTYGSEFLRQRYLSTQTVIEIDGIVYKLNWIEDVVLEYKFESGDAWVDSNYGFGDGLKYYEYLDLTFDRIDTEEIL